MIKSFKTFENIHPKINVGEIVGRMLFKEIEKIFEESDSEGIVEYTNAYAWRDSISIRFSCVLNVKKSDLPDRGDGFYRKYYGVKKKCLELDKIVDFLEKCKSDIKFVENFNVRVISHRYSGKGIKKGDGVIEYDLNLQVISKTFRTFADRLQSNIEDINT